MASEKTMDRGYYRATGNTLEDLEVDVEEYRKYGFEVSKEPKENACTPKYEQMMILWREAIFIDDTTIEGVFFPKGHKTFIHEDVAFYEGSHDGKERYYIQHEGKEIVTDKQLGFEFLETPVQIQQRVNKHYYG